MEVIEKNAEWYRGFLDDNTELKSCGACSVIGTSRDVTSYSDADLVVANGNAKNYQKL